MMNTSTAMTMKAAHKGLQRALQLLLAMVTLLIVLLVQSFASHVQAADHLPLEPEAIRLINEERSPAQDLRRAEDTSMIVGAGLRTREAAQRFSHTRPDGSKRHTVIVDFEEACEVKGMLLPHWSVATRDTSTIN